MSTIKCVIQECGRSQPWGFHEDRVLTRAGTQPGPDSEAQGAVPERTAMPILTHPPGQSGGQGQGSFS